MRINSFIDQEELTKSVCQLSPEESHHLVRVLRVTEGQLITLFDGCGTVADGVIESAHKTAVEVRVTHRKKVPKPEVEIDLIQAVPKSDRWDLVLQKAVELGASNIYPILSQHTEFKPSAKKSMRWEKIVRNAAQQCEVAWLPTLHPVEPIETVSKKLKSYDLSLIGSLYEGSQPFRDIPLDKHKRISLIIGPEGDFSQGEVETLVENGATPVSFGDRILRTETAAIFGLSVLAYALL